MSSFEAILSQIPSVSLGYGGVDVFFVEDLPSKQRGCSVSSAGEALWGDAAGDWRKEWIVIGCESMCGDPIFIDTATDGCPVYTAMHGEGDWIPRPVAASLEGFREAVEVVAKVAQGREDPAAIQDNPITPAERDQALRAIRQSNPGMDLSFWLLLFDEDPEAFGDLN